MFFNTVFTGFLLYIMSASTAVSMQKADTSYEETALPHGTTTIASSLEVFQAPRAKGEHIAVLRKGVLGSALPSRTFFEIVTTGDSDKTRNVSVIGNGNAQGKGQGKGQEKSGCITVRLFDDVSIEKTRELTQVLRTIYPKACSLFLFVPSWISHEVFSSSGFSLVATDLPHAPSGKAESLWQVSLGSIAHSEKLVHDLEVRETTGWNTEPLMEVTHELGVFVRDPQTKEILGGITGEFFPKSAMGQISLFWTHEKLRGKGWGSVLEKAFVKAMQDKGAQMIVVGTEGETNFSIYKRLGYGKILYALPLPEQRTLWGLAKSLK